MDLYVAGHKTGRSHRGRGWIVACLIIVLGAGAFAAQHFLSSDTSLGSMPPISTTTVSTPKQNKKHIDERFFGLDLPADWQPVAPPRQPYAVHSWQNTAQNKGARRLDIYVDGAPRLAVNRVLPIQANGARLVLLGQVSDNCITFTEGAKQTAAASMLAKWRGVKFLCDTANHERNVTGTSSPTGIDDVTLAGSGKHSFFFVYTDNSATPDYDLFTNIITSFQAK